MHSNIFAILLATSGICSAFLQQVKSPFHVNRNKAVYAKKSGDDVVQQHAFSAGTFVEFQEKKRSHLGKITGVEHKGNGGARYTVTDSEGKNYGIADKQVLYSMPCPTSPGQAAKLYSEFCRCQDAPLSSIEDQLEVTSDLLEMAWEEVADDEENKDHTLTSDSFITLVHSHVASAMEKYLAWKLLKSDMSHVFFKEIKENGRVVAFKAKTRKAVDAAKETFCRTHEDSEICFV